MSYTVKQIHLVRDIFLQLGLPLELASLILDAAEVWYPESYNRHTFLDLQIMEPSAGASSLYLQTGPLGYSRHLNHISLVRPRRVVFTLATTLRLQYLNGGHPPVPGGHESKSWFDACIFREDDSWSGGERLPPLMAIKDHKPHQAKQNFRWIDARTFWSENPRALPVWLSPDGVKAHGGFKLVPDNERPMWLLWENRNVGVTAEVGIQWEDSSFRDIVWDLDGNRGYRSKETLAYDEGMGINFVASLKRGDRIGVWAKADGWFARNIVKSLEMKVYYSIV